MAYTYLIGWSRQNKWYYGCRYIKGCHPKEFWISYFTSSEYVKKYRLQYGEPDVIQIRCIFRTKEAALRCEERILDKANAVYSDKWLNKGNAGKNFNSTTAGEKISKSCKGRTAWNKGIPNSQQSKRMKQNNPNKKGKFGGFKKGNIPWNKLPEYSFSCKECQNKVIQPLSKKKDKSTFCSKSCAVRYRNKHNHWRSKQLACS